MSQTALRHKAEAPSKVGAFIVTCSTSKYLDSWRGKEIQDASGDIIEDLFKKNGHAILGRRLISDNAAMIKQTLREALALKGVDCTIITGGTGVSPRDLTIEVARDLIEKELPGFGELFRKISYEEIGTPAIMTRAIAGVTKGKVIFCLPGSPDAVQRAMTRLILPEVGHIIKHARES